MKLAELKKTAKAINALEIFDDKISVTAKQDELKSEIAVAAQQLEEEEIESLDEVCQNVIAEILEEVNGGEAEEEEEEEEEEEKPAKKAASKKSTKKAKKEEPEEEEEEEEEEEGGSDDLMDQINDMEEEEDVKGMKALIKSEDVFKPLRGKTNFVKKADQLADKMRALLEPEEEEEEEEKPAKKSGKKEKATPAKKTEKVAPKKKEKKMSRIAACTKALLDEPKDFKAWVAATDEVMEENGGVSNPQESAAQCRKLTEIATVHDFGVEVPKYKK